MTIRKLDFEREINVADELMRELHEAERTLNPRTDIWEHIRENYLAHIRSCLEENEGIFLIAETDGLAVGFIFGYIDEPDESDFEGGEGRDLYVSEGYVRPQYRRQGIYTKLNEAFEAHYRNSNIRRVYRYTLVNNSVMHRWLAQQGYQPIRLVYEKWWK